MAVCVHVSMEEVGTKPASLSANRRDGQGAHRMDVSSSLISREEPLGRLLAGTEVVPKRGRHDFIRKVKKQKTNPTEHREELVLSGCLGG